MTTDSSTAAPETNSDRMTTKQKLVLAFVAATTLGVLTGATVSKEYNEDIYRYAVANDNAFLEGYAEFFGANPQWALLAAAEENHVGEMETLLAKGIKPNAWTVAMTAREGKLEALKRLIQEGDNIEGRKEILDVDCEIVAFAYAASNGHTHVMDYLHSERGIDVDARKSWALWLSIVSGEQQSIKWLLENGATPNPESNMPLSAAVLGQDNDVDMLSLRKLLDTGAFTIEQLEDGIATMEEYDNKHYPQYKVLQDEIIKLKALHEATHANQVKARPKLGL